MARLPSITRMGGAALLVMIVTVVALAHAQTGTPIRYGDTVSGEITAGTPCQYYWFEGHAGDAITIDMARVSGTLDGVLALYQQDGHNFSDAPVATSDDRPGGGLDPLIEVTLAATDWHTIAACRLQDELIVTEGAFSLTLAGPTTPAASEPSGSGGNLSDSVFGETGAQVTPAPTQEPPVSVPSGQGGAATEEPPMVTLLDGGSSDGQLGSGVAEVRYALLVSAGDQVMVEWQQIAGEIAPDLRVTDATGALIAQAGTPDPVRQLTLMFVAPEAGTLALAVARYPGADTSAASDYQVRVLIVSATGDTVAPGESAAAPESTAPATNPLTSPCQSGANVVFGPASSIYLLDAMTASGDSFDPDELMPTADFLPDDDLNMVFGVQNAAVPVSVTGVFCGPGDALADFDEERFENGGPYLLGLDWEYRGEAWETGNWYVELYVDGTLELTLGFTVR
jgi:hypothetical protein